VYLQLPGFAASILSQAATTSSTLAALAGDENIITTNSIIGTAATIAFFRI